MRFWSMMHNQDDHPYENKSVLCTLSPRRMQIAKRLYTSCIRAHPYFCVMERLSRISVTRSFHDIKICQNLVSERFWHM